MSRYGRILLLLLAAAPSSSLLAQIGNIPPPTARPPRAIPRQVGPLGGPQVREGFWMSGGLGYGALNCDPGIGGTGGFTRAIEAGWTLSRRVLLGVGAGAWNKGFGRRLGMTVGSVDLRVRWYPSEKMGNFFLIGAWGLGFIRLSDELADPQSHTATGRAFRGGLGYDIRLARGVSVTPFASGTAVRTEDHGDHMRAEVWQLGLGLTLH